MWFASRQYRQTFGRSKETVFRRTQIPSLSNFRDLNEIFLHVFNRHLLEAWGNDWERTPLHPVMQNAHQS